MPEQVLVIDDRTGEGLGSSLGRPWRLVTDSVMGGVSTGRLTVDRLAARDCLRLTGAVSLENNGGFVQAALDLDDRRPFDASAYDGIELDVLGNGEPYNVHLRTAGMWLPWQAHRATFDTTGEWRTVRLPFTAFAPYQVTGQFDRSRLRRIGLVAIGRAFDADLCVARLALYRAD
jgi:hypothetical protein